MIDELYLKTLIEGAKKTGVVSPVTIDGQVFLSDGKNHYQKRKHMFEKLNMNFSKSDSLIEPGCNWGVNLYIFKELYPDLSLYGYEISSGAVALGNYILKEKGFDVKILNENAYKANYKKHNYILHYSIDVNYDTLRGKLDLYNEQNFHGSVIVVTAKRDNGVDFDKNDVDFVYNEVLKNYKSYIIHDEEYDDDLVIINL